jgi:hypothetical protein
MAGLVPGLVLHQYRSRRGTGGAAWMLAIDW